MWYQDMLNDAISSMSDSKLTREDKYNKILNW